MQGKGFVITLAILFVLVSIGALSHTFYVKSIESKAERLSDGSPQSYKEKLAEVSKDTLNLVVTKLNYSSSKEKEMNLGLDLKGGINVMLQISIKDLLLELSDKSENAIFRKALDKADLLQTQSNDAYLKNFFDSFDQLKKENGGKPNLADFDIFGNKKNDETIKINLTDAEVKKIITENIEASINTAYDVFKTRIDKFGVAQPNVQRIPNTGRILVELPGATDAERIKKLLQTSARLEFWNVVPYENIIPFVGSLSIDSIRTNNLSQLLNIQAVQQGKIQTGGTFGAAKVVDTAAINKILKSKSAKEKMVGTLKYVKFLWASKADRQNPEYLALYAINGNRKDSPLLEGAVENAAVNPGQYGGFEINMQMNSEGAQAWGDITRKNIGKQIAIVLDDLVYSAPTVNGAILGGNSSITGQFTKNEAQDVVDALKSGKLPASAKIVQSDVVGPSLGKESIRAGFISIAFAFIAILFWMFFYYGRAGLYANIALLLNLFLIFGALASLGAVLTLPGIAGLVLTLGIAVDANIIIFERVKEELKKGKVLQEAFQDGYKNALSAIIDGNVTTFITAAILLYFGTGPVKGFATTLIIGIISTLFTALLINRLLIEARLKKGKEVTFWTSITKNWFEKANFNWMGNRKYAYAISATILIVSLISLATRQLNYGVDFKGGRTYTIKLDKSVNPNDLGKELTKAFPVIDGAPSSLDAKTFGEDNQVKLTTKYKFEDDGASVDPEIENLLYTNLKKYLPTNFSFEDFKLGEKYGIQSSSKVGPTIADDIKEDGVIAISLSLLGIFLYILFRFNKWEFSTGAVAALFHDALIVLGLFSLLFGFLPFSLEIDQAFIAAILTVIGYSINDTVIVFDRIRENLKEHTSMSLHKLVNLSINQTLGRTFNTSATTLFVIIIIFIFGGENLRGFMFALLVGIGVGTFSSVFVASAIMYDLLKKKLKSREA